MSNRRRSVAWMTALVVCGFAATAWAADTTVPDTVGLQLEEARALAAKAGFEVSVTPVAGHPVGLVVSQEPGGLASRPKGSTISLRVGGPTPKPGMGPALPGPTMPPTDKPPRGNDDLGAPPAGAGDAPVQPPTVRPGVRRAPPGATPGVRPVNPPAGRGGSLVWRGRALPEGRMPDTNGPDIPSVLGQTAPQARRILSRWNVNVEQTMAVPELVGKVVNQMPFAGSRLAPSETVTIVVAVAEAPSPDHVFVPQASGKDWLEGLQALEDGGLRPTPRSVRSTSAERGRILQQIPHTGSLAPRGSAVEVLVGRGPVDYSAEAPQPTEPTEPDVAPPSEPTPREPIELPPRQPKEPTPTEPPDDAPPAGTPPSPMPTEPVEPAPVEPAPAEPTPPTDEPTPAPSSLAAPSLSTPPAGESYPYKYGADFAWGAITGAEGYELELQEEQPSGAWTSVGTWPTTAPKYRPAKIDRGRYRWRVRATAGETKGLWSEFRRLYMY